MRIGMMADGYKPHVSGVTIHISLNKQFLEQAGHEVFVFTFGDEGNVDDEPNVIRTPGMPLVDSGIYFNLRYSPKAQRLLRTMDVAHVHHPFFSGSLALRYCKPRGIPIVFTNHTRYDLYAQFYTPEPIPDVIGDVVVRAFVPKFCRACDLVIAPSPGIKEVLRKFGVDGNVEIVPNGVDLAPFQMQVEPIQRAELGFQGDQVILTYMGRLGPEKNLPFLLRAFKGVALTYDHVGLLIVGDGPERENLVEQARLLGIANRVHFTGMIPYSQLPRYLAAADAFVTASVTEVHPLSVIESMAAGLPVLGIQSPGVGDIVEHGVTGLIAPDQDLAVFTAGMVRLVTDPQLRNRMSEQARAAATNYAIERTTQLILEKYQQLIEKKVGKKQGLRTRLTLVVDKVLR
ncbi:MAG TPA: glycosyltransferase [Anaerolineales bacterium]|nr:glycosyltransferase [Anaerolineales bacterium]